MRLQRPRESSSVIVDVTSFLYPVARSGEACGPQVAGTEHHQGHAPLDVVTFRIGVVVAVKHVCSLAVSSVRVSHCLCLSSGEAVFLLLIFLLVTGLLLTYQKSSHVI